MATAFAASTIVEPHVSGGFAHSEGIYKLTMPSSYTTGGHTWDLSDDFDYIYGMDILSSTKITHVAYQFGIYGADHSSAKGTAAATATFIGFWQTDTATAPGVQITNATDLTSTVEYLYVRISGRKL